jgi:hypothetical protein
MKKYSMIPSRWLQAGNRTGTWFPFLLGLYRVSLTWNCRLEIRVSSLTFTNASRMEAAADYAK